jgi:hypothetical protein
LTDIDTGWIGLLLAALTLLAMSGIVAYQTIKLKRNPASSGAASSLGFIALYSGLMLYSVSTTMLTPLNDRYLGPLYVPILVALFCVVSDTLPRGGTSRPLLIGLVVGFVLSGQVDSVIRQARVALRYGISGYNRSYYSESKTISWLRSNPLQGQIYTNSVQSLYLWAQITSQISPSKFGRWSSAPAVQTEVAQNLEDFKGAIRQQDQNTYLVWIAHEDRPNLYTPQELAEFCDMKVLARFDDGMVLQIKAKDSGR